MPGKATTPYKPELIPAAPRFGAALALMLTAMASLARAAPAPYVVLKDDGAIETTKYDSVPHVRTIESKLLSLYADAGQPLPDVLSVWTTFPFNGNFQGTFGDPFGLDVKGIGLGDYYPPDGTTTFRRPPLRYALFHNSVLKLKERAATLNAPEAGIARYFFLLELSHLWGPALHVPGATPGELIGFPFHWSFFMDAGGSLAGGNHWQANGDGTFTAVAADPSTLGYSLLDLYVMGLATPDEVPPFAVLENAVVPSTPTDTTWGGPHAARSFPWFDSGNGLTVQATRKTFTIDDVIAANGRRDPAAGASPTSWKVGIVLLTSMSDSAETVASAKAIFDPIAAQYAPAFAAATSGRGTLEIVTQGTAPDDAAADAGDASVDAGDAAAPDGTAMNASSCACRTATNREGNTTTGLRLLAGFLVAARARKRARAVRA